MSHYVKITPPEPWPEPPEAERPMAPAGGTIMSCDPSAELCQLRNETQGLKDKIHTLQMLCADRSNESAALQIALSETEVLCVQRSNAADALQLELDDARLKIAILESALEAERKDPWGK